MSPNEREKPTARAAAPEERARLEPELVSGYQRARLQVVVSSALILLWHFGITFEGPLPLLGVRVTEVASLPYLIAAVLAYSLCRLLIEWSQSDKARRRRTASRLDFGITLLIAGTAGLALLFRLAPGFTIPSLSVLVPSIALVALGLATGGFVSTSLFGLFFLRSKAVALGLGLHRLPVGVRSSFRALMFVLAGVVLAICLAPAFSSPLSFLWPWLLAGPVILTVIPNLLSFLLRRPERADGTPEPRSKRFAGMRRAFEEHDARYQVGGWDKPAPSVPTPLYAAAEPGDLTGVRRLLDGGWNPDERSVLGWTPLAIAVANNHADVALLLIERGADPNIPNLLGRTPLMFAARYGHVDLVRELIKHGAQPGLNRSPDPSALSAAAREGHQDVVTLLLEAGADPTIRDWRGHRAEEYAGGAGQGQIAGILRRARLEKER